MMDMIRQLELFDPYNFKTPITVIGAGATGSWLTLCLAKLGIENITVYDFDVVESHNIPNQAFRMSYYDGKDKNTVDTDIGKMKVESLQSVVYDMTKTEIEIKPEKYTNQRLNGIVFLMVDSMAERKRIWETSIKMKPSIKLLIEPRMGLNLGRIYNVIPTSLNHIKEYEQTYYSDDNAEVSACGASMTVITTAMSIASICARQVINFANDIELDNEIIIDLMYNNFMNTQWEI